MCTCEDDILDSARDVCKSCWDEWESMYWEDGGEAGAE